MPLSRRSCLALLAGSGVARADDPRVALPGAAGERRYRVDAVITFFSIPILSRSGVGSGYALHRESRREGVQMHTLGFASGSWPERARGLNRFGYIQEQALERNAALREASYFGFMTSSREETLEEAKKALAKDGAEVQVAAIQGSMAAGSSKSALTRLSMGPNFSWASWRPSLPQIHRAVGAAPPQRLDEQPDAVARPFLYTLMQAMKQGPARAEYSYSYGAKRYSLQFEKRLDLRAGAALQKRGLVAKKSDVCRLAGLIRQASSNKQTRFSIWFDVTDPSCLPLRVDLQARSFLRLILETDPALPGFEFPELAAVPHS